jgi:hypothetical protein
MNAPLLNQKDQNFHAVPTLADMLDDLLHGLKNPGPVRDVPLTPAMDFLRASFGLTDFETHMLLMLAAHELDSRFVPLFPQGLTFQILAARRDDAHLSSLSPARPLRQWLFIHMEGTSLTRNLVRIDERILHYLTGQQSLDPHIRDCAASLPIPSTLAASHQNLIDQALHYISAHAMPLIVLTGQTLPDQRLIAAKIAHGLGCQAYEITHKNASRDAELSRLLERETVLAEALFVVEDVGLAERVHAPLLLLLRDGQSLPTRPHLCLEVNALTYDERLILWQAALKDKAALQDKAALPDNAPYLPRLAYDFPLSAAEINLISAEFQNAVPSENRLRAACRRHSPLHIPPCVDKLPALAAWEDLVLGEGPLNALKSLAAQVKYQAQVYQQWGFARHSTRGLGITALFAGPSGTGKTLAAEVLAHELDLMLLRIDLSQVVSKYIGETEKQLDEVFKAGERGGAILLFDEADALFGKRSDVKDSHDRYANIEVGYLLQRMESYRGLAVLTSNLKGSLDEAFLRRLRFVIQFPFPDIATRMILWQKAFPPETPLEDMDWKALARLNLSGGNIRNVALNAAFLAAESGESISLTHIQRAAQNELMKLERPVPSFQLKGGGT